MMLAVRTVRIVVYTLANTTQLTKSAALTDGSSSLRSYVNAEWIYSLKTDIFCCLATVSNNSCL